MGDMAKILIVSGCLLIMVGGALLLFGKMPWIGKLPGDFIKEGEHFKFYFPLTTCLLLSLALTVILNIVMRIWSGR